MFTCAGKREEGLAIAPFLVEVGQHLVQWLRLQHQLSVSHNTKTHHDWHSD